MTTRLNAMIRGHKSAVAKLLSKFELAQSEEAATLDDAIAAETSLRTKMDKIRDLHVRIIEAIPEDRLDEIEVEIVDQEEYMDDIQNRLQKITSYRVSRTNVNTNSCTDPDLAHEKSSSSHFQRLPKLTLPLFNGAILEWQTFWDSFETTIHSNADLSDIQKFSYLKSLLEGEAARCIHGFALTNANYIQAIDVLQNRFGKKTKVTQTYMNALLRLPKPTNTVNSLREYYDSLETYIRGLESLGHTQDTYGSLLVPAILNNLPSDMRKTLARENISEDWALGDLRTKLRNEIAILEVGNSTHSVCTPEMTASFLTESSSRQNKLSRDQSYRKKTDSKKSQPYEKYSDSRKRNANFVCVFCEEQHSPNECRNVIDHKNRDEIVKRKRLCFNCLGRHLVSNCTSRNRCRACHKKHHTSICPTDSETASAPGVNSSTLNTNAVPFEPSNETRVNSRSTASDSAFSTISQSASLHSQSQQRHSVLLKTAVSKVKFEENCVDANILMDEGAQRSFITRSLADQLQLKTDETDTIHLTAFGDPAHSVKHLDVATIDLIADNGDLIPIRVLVVPFIAKPINIQSQRSAASLSYLHGLKLAHPVNADETFEISLLIGADYYWQIVGDEVVRGDGPTAVSSRIGYFLSGPLSQSSGNSFSSNIMEVIASHVADTTDLSQFWEIESMGISSKESDSNANEYLEHYQDNCVNFANGQYVARLPWKLEHPPLPPNFNIARKRTESTIRRLTKEPHVMRKYGDIIQEQEKRGFIEKVQNDCAAERVHYIPHHGVKKESITTPIRIVYDCSCRQSESSSSLNDCLESVPPQLNDLTVLLMRFRLGKYAVSTDIEKAFLHVGLHEDDRDVTRFLWLSDPTDPDSPLDTYRFKAVLFGATCSPFILNAVLMKHLQRNQDNPAADVLARDLYVDNVISSFEEEEHLLHYFAQARDLMGKAGFNLRSWCSNSINLQQLAATEEVQDRETVAKILGMRWDSRTDRLYFVERPIAPNPVVTKRVILQQTSRIYDPLGVLSPVTVRAKLLVQSLWKQKYDWDTPLPTEIADDWTNLACDLNDVMKTTMARSYLPANASHQNQTTLHVFVDASTKSYGATAYLCSENKSAFVFAKNRVAPVNGITLPRLELMAALVGARLAAHVKKAVPCEKIVFWSDSQIVLYWLKSPKKLNRFVTNRVIEINELTSGYPWRYCPSEENPADLLTRGITSRQFQDSTLWREGPAWLLDNRKWPTWDIEKTATLTSLTESESEQCDTCLSVQVDRLHEIVDVSRYSDYRKLLRVTAYVMRFVANCRARSSSHRQLGPLTADELRDAEHLWISDCQRNRYSDVIESISGHVKQTSIVRQLRLFIDDRGLIRCGGRLHNAQLDETTKFPYLLPAKHPVSELIVTDAHRSQLHAGVNQTVIHLRQKFWITAMRQYVKTVLRHCVTCRKVTGKPYRAPESPPLPRVRVNEESPFTVTGVDFTGALHTKETNSFRRKAYICLFTCASTRAVHLELVSDLSEESFLLAFRRFVSRRSLPKLMISDNGTTFQAAANQLRRLFNSLNVQTELHHRGVEWQFIPKRAPWYGGWWERLIGITKTTIKKVLGKSCVDFRTLQTILTEVEAIMNDRPLTYVSSSADDPEPLTPSHLLNGRRLTTLPFSDPQIDINHGGFHVTRADISQRAKRHAELIKQYWHRWRHEYLTALRELHSGNGSKGQTIRVGAVVQIQDDFQPRTRWHLGKVDELITGNDGLVRAARVKTGGGVTTLPIVKLYPIEVVENRD